MRLFSVTARASIHLSPGTILDSFVLFVQASGATREAQFISYCRLLQPREIAKSF
jgi:hypothetical protein